jgi:cell division protein FtsL
MPKAISLLLAFIFISITLIIISFKQETDKLNAVIKKDKVLIDSLKGELEIEIFEKSRYINIVEQVSEVNCKEVKEIINGTE